MVGTIANRRRGVYWELFNGDNRSLGFGRLLLHRDSCFFFLSVKTRPRGNDMKCLERILLS